jgi:hypothetical protein
VYLRRLFPEFRLLRHAGRAIAPTIPAAAAVLLARGIEDGERTAAMAVVELVAYLAVTVAATFWLERALLREAFGYLRGGLRSSVPAGVEGRGAVGGIEG